MVRRDILAYLAGSAKPGGAEPSGNVGAGSIRWLSSALSARVPSTFDRGQARTFRQAVRSTSVQSSPSKAHSHASQGKGTTMKYEADDPRRRTLIQMLAAGL